ncbi:hypothetical protein OAE15_01270 [Verrucomicrobiales bacterium]|nr:hypothetical protein [Verrucomicrobiales bacterium]
MIMSTLLKLSHKLTRLGSTLTLLSLGGTSLVFTSCTTEEGVIAGALAGAAIGGIVGHSQEHNCKRSKRHYHNGYGYGYGYNNVPRRNSYRGARYSSYRGNSYAADPYRYY